MELTEGFRALRVECDPHTVRATLSRPERQNPVDSLLVTELHRVLDLAEQRPACRLVLLAGADGVFCTGMDFAEAVGDGPPDDGGSRFFELLRRLTTAPRLIVCLVRGRVAGGGVGLVAASDLVVASGASTFALPEALWGLLPCSVLPFLVRRVGFQRAYAMTLTTLPVGAAQAAAGGLVDQVADDPAALVRRLTYRLGKVHPDTLAAAKRYCAGLAPITDSVRDRAAAEFSRLLSSPRVRRDLTDFVDHRRMPWEH